MTTNFDTLVSVCIPAYKADRFLSETLATIQGQSWTNWEVIVTEDGSSDRTKDLVDAFASKVTQSVIYNRHDKNRGLPHTRNTGVAAARGQWIAFLDSDDLWKPNHLERLIATITAAKSDVAFSGSILFHHESHEILGEYIPTSSQLDTLAISVFMGSLLILPSSVLIRRDSFQRFGPVSTDFLHVNDTEYWLRVLTKGGSIAYSGEATCLYRKHPDSMSMRFSELLCDNARACELYADSPAIPRGLRSRRPADLYRWAALTSLKQQPNNSLSLIRDSLRLQPLNPKNLLALVKVLAAKV